MPVLLSPLLAPGDESATLLGAFFIASCAAARPITSSRGATLP